MNRSWMRENPPYLSKHSISAHEEISIAFYIELLCDCSTLCQTKQKCNSTKMIKPICVFNLLLIDKDLLTKRALLDG